MFESFTEPEWVGFSFVLLGMALICGLLVRRLVPRLAALYVPASVLAGFVILLVGPQVLGKVTNGWSLIPERTIPVLSALPGLARPPVTGTSSFYEPFLGGGILTALSVPIILSIGSLAFGIASAAVTAGLIIWGVARNRSS